MRFNTLKKQKQKKKLLILSCWHLKLLFRTMMIWFEFLCEAKLPFADKFFVTAEDCGWLYRHDCWPPVVISALSQKILSGETSAVISPQLVLIVLAWNESSTNVRISNHFSMIHPVCNGLSKHEMCKNASSVGELRTYRRAQCKFCILDFMSLKKMWFIWNYKNDNTACFSMVIIQA